MVEFRHERAESAKMAWYFTKMGLKSAAITLAYFLQVWAARLSMYFMLPKFVSAHGIGTSLQL